MNNLVKMSVQSGAMFGGLFTLCFSPVFVIMGFLVHPAIGLGGAVLCFLSTAIPFGLFIGLFAGMQQKRFLGMQLVPEDETLVHQDGANHFDGLEGVGGWLYLTDRMLRFKPHEFNIQRRELAIPLEEIADVSLRRTGGLFANGLLVRTRDGGEEKFVVNNRQRWVRDILQTQQEAGVVV